MIRTAALNCQGLLGRAVEELEGTPSANAAAAQVKALADALESGSESVVFEATMVLEKGSREDLNRLLDGLEAELTHRMGASADRKRLFRAVELVKQLRGAAQLNANPGQLAGWLCAGMFK